MARRFLAVFLASVLAYGNFGVQVALGVEAAGGSVDVTAQTLVSDEKNEPAETDATATDDTTTDDTTVESADAVADPAVQASNDAAAETPAVTSADSNDAAQPSTTAEDQLPYSIEVTFDGQTLSDGANDLTNVWTTGSKGFNVKLTRNKSVAVDPTKQYVLCMSVPTALYFSGLPEADKINGVENVAIVKNTMPKLNATLGNDYTYPLSPYSGQIRMLLNTTVDNIEVADQSILFDPKLVGYKVSENTVISDALDIRVIAVDANEKLEEFSDGASKDIVSRKVNSLQILNGEKLTTDSGLRMRLSSDGFVNEAMTGGTPLIGRTGNVAYALESGQKNPQVYSELTVVMHCPYIEVNGEKHYLDFDPNDSVLKTNEKGSQRGPKMAKDAVYDEQNHTITYTFNNVYLSAWQVIAVSPQFKWPSDLDDSVTIPESGIRVDHENWELTTEKTFCGYDSELLPRSHKAAGSYSGYATFMPDGVDMAIQSSAENVVETGSPANSTFGQRVIYKGVTRANGVQGGLGFFDIHNKGVSDAPSSKVTFDFNTEGGTGATYYVTQVNVPADGNTNGVDVQYVLVNGDNPNDEISGTLKYDKTSSFTVYATALRTNSGKSASSPYYIKQLSYTTAIFRKNATYHTEVSHGRRNFVNDYGLFFGFMEGDVSKTACATLTIESDGGALNKAGDTKLVSTETSTIGDDDSITYGFSTRPTVDGGASKSITAGDTVTLSFASIISNAEDQARNLETNQTNIGTLNGYHIMRDPIVYVCLPEGVSIVGVNQATVTHKNVNQKTETINATSVSRMANSNCVVDGVNAAWWEVRFENVNIDTNPGTFRLQLSTSSLMAGVSWNFEKAVAVRAYGQAYKTTGTTDGSSPQMNTLKNFKSSASGNAMLSALATGLEGDAYKDKLGLAYYTYGASTVLNISRAEAKLDVDTELSTGSTVSKDLKVTDADTTVNYQVDVKSTDGGSAENFNYYIPIAKQSSALDTGSFVSQKDYDLKLKDAVSIEDLSSSSGENPFEVLYTTKAGLDSTSVAELQDGTNDPNVGWVDADDLNGNYGAVTAVLIRTKTKASVKDGAKYRFNLALGYDNTNDDFASQAGRVVKWRSFGHYAYTRNGAETTNTYPSQDNSVKLGYSADYTSTPIIADINTGAADNIAGFGFDFKQGFKKDQKLTIKKVKVSERTTLIKDDPSTLTGASANSSFRMAVGVNGPGTDVLTNDFTGGSYNITAGTNVKLNGGVRFSRALTDTAMARYVDVTIGNDDLTLTVRIELRRTVVAADVNGSGTAAGENFQTVGVSTDQTTVASNAAFTALYDVKNFVPGNFTAQKLVWKAGDQAAKLPAGTNITMMVLGSDNKVQSWWLYTAEGTESTVYLSDFKRMSGTDSYKYDTSSTAAAELKYQFVVSLPSGGTSAGSYSLGFAADAKSGVAEFKTVDLPIKLAEPVSFKFSVSGQTVSYTYNKPSYEDTRNSGKLLALVLIPKAGSTLPADAKVTVAGTDTPYARNASGDFIVPLGTVDSGEKSVELGLVSNMASADGIGVDCQFDVSLREFAGVGTSPMAGLEVGTGTVELAVSAGDKPSLKVKTYKTGTDGKTVDCRVATRAEWAAGVKFDFNVQNVPADATITVTSYQELSGSKLATDLLSNVGDFFDVNAAVGTWKSDRPVGEGKLLKLSSAAKAGTYRLVFEVKRGDDVLLTVPYYIVVRE